MIERRGILVGIAAICLSGCGGGSDDPDDAVSSLDIDGLTTLTADTAIALVNNWAQSNQVLISRGVTGLEQSRLVKTLVPEVLADLTLFSAEATSRPKDVRVVVLGQDAPDTLVSQRALTLFKVLGRALSVGALERRAVTDLVLLSQLSGAVTRALDTGKRIQGGTFTIVLEGLAYDGTRLLETGTG